MMHHSFNHILYFRYNQYISMKTHFSSLKNSNNFINNQNY